MKISKRAFVVNGRKESKHRVFLLRHARIHLSWDTNEYLKLPIGIIKEQIRVERERGYHKEAFGY